MFFQPVHSVGHLRRLVEMSENLAYEISSRYVSKANIPVARQQVCAVEQLNSEVEDNLQEEYKIHAF